MADDCLFCRIVSGALPARKLYEDDEILAFLDIFPVRPGHALVIPKAHYPWFEDMPPELAARVMRCGQALARRMKQLYPVERVALAFTGIHVPHAHAHIVPMHEIHDMTSLAYLQNGPGSFSPPPQLPDADMDAAAHDLRLDAI